MARTIAQWVLSSSRMAPAISSTSVSLATARGEMKALPASTLERLKHGAGVTDRSLDNSETDPFVTEPDKAYTVINCPIEGVIFVILFIVVDSRDVKSSLFKCSTV